MPPVDSRDWLRREKGPAEQAADERALFELVPLQDETGCGARKKDDCYPCLRTSNELDDTIAAVRTRTR